MVSGQSISDSQVEKGELAQIPNSQPGNDCSLALKVSLSIKEELDCSNSSNLSLIHLHCVSAEEAPSNRTTQAMSLLYTLYAVLALIPIRPALSLLLSHYM